ncbi:YopX family protein [Paenibacillus sp. FSL R10-2796]|uniref:YopX family protein n=1 Tax=Paenibacillus sp. FSL R10-2796 TaxID=2954663 RepID=UPI0030DB4EFE
MGREIKFRAWLKEEKRMLDKVALTWPGSEMIIQWYDSLDDYYAGALSDCSERDAEVMQYTGLKDKNGREIYEGDIISEDYFSNVNPNDHSDDEYMDDTPRKFIICYDSKQGRYKAVPPEMYQKNAGNGGWTGYDVRGYKSDVIGSIFENPELIEV